MYSAGIAPYVMATVHPSAILRVPDDESRHEEMRRFVEDLALVARQLNSRKAA
jgi:DNA polymerase